MPTRFSSAVPCFFLSIDFAKNFMRETTIFCAYISRRLSPALIDRHVTPSMPHINCRPLPPELRQLFSYYHLPHWLLTRLLLLLCFKKDDFSAEVPRPLAATIDSFITETSVALFEVFLMTSLAGFR